MFADVAIDVPLRQTFTYTVPDALEKSLQIGMRVGVAFGRTKNLGVCVSTALAPDQNLNPEHLKPILFLPDEKPLLNPTYLKWLTFAATYYAAPLGQVIAQAIPAPYLDVKKTASLKKLKSRDLPISDAFPTKTVDLTETQKNIADNIAKNMHAFQPVLIKGVTGSGKTEVYIHLIKGCLKRGRSVLFLVPEIGLTPQMLSRLHHHFKSKVLSYHSGLSPNQRFVQWNRCREEEAQILVGTRSAVFAPFPNLGLIVIDEEHDSSYKQEDRFRYHARDLAIMRAQMLNIPVVMGSATPSLESFYQAKNGAYRYFELNERVTGAPLPRVSLIDFGREREQTKKPFLVSQTIHAAIDSCFKNHRQMMIFVGQRGFAQNAYCVSCKKSQTCLNCSVGLKFHKHGKLLKCHYCDFAKNFDEICLSCGDKALILLGFGTQSIEDEIRVLHPRVKICRLDSDATTPNQISAAFAAFARREIDLLIGTQIISKGHDFPNVGFVGVLGVDVHLGLPDFRAGERSFQSLVQVAGRSGRGSETGEVLIQSLMPEHPILRLGVEQDFHKFAQIELKWREELHYPPFFRIMDVRFLSANAKRLKDFLNQWKIFLAGIERKYRKEDLLILGPTEMPIAKIRGNCREHVVFKIRRGLKSTDFVDFIVSDLEKRKLRGLKYQIDVDALNLM